MSNTISGVIVIPTKYKGIYRKSLDPLPIEWDNCQNSKGAANGGSVLAVFYFLFISAGSGFAEILFCEIRKVLTGILFSSCGRERK